jgi:hypothetical protein
LRRLSLILLVVRRCARREPIRSSAPHPTLGLTGVLPRARKRLYLQVGAVVTTLGRLDTDDVLELFAAVGTFEELPEKIAARFGGISDTTA